MRKRGIEMNLKVGLKIWRILRENGRRMENFLRDWRLIWEEIWMR